MAIERASMRAVGKPWGSTDLRPWSEIHGESNTIGEIWFQRADVNAPVPALLLKLLFTQKPLSIQVHPNDTMAQSMGLAFDKTEAWYILAAKPGSTIAIGFKRQLAGPDLRASIEDGTIADVVQWHRALKDDLIFVPAGMIHAIGAGLMVVEIQQNSDATFRLFDQDRHRQLHISPHFVLERIDLVPHSNRELNAEHETWVLVLEGHGRFGPMSACVGENTFLDADRPNIDVGAVGLAALVAYLGSEPIPGLLQNLDGRAADREIQDILWPQPDPRDMAGSPVRSMEARL